MKPSPEIEQLFSQAAMLAGSMKHDILTPEHVLRTLIDDSQFREAVLFVDIDLDAISAYLDDFLATLDTVDDIPDYEPVEGLPEEDREGGIDLSYMMMRAYGHADAHAHSSGSACVTMPLLVNAILSLGPDAPAVIALQAYADCTALLEALATHYGSGRTDDTDDDGIPNDFEEYDDKRAGQADRAPWRSLVTCITQQLRERPDSRGPFIGREAELERTIQVLCRCDKNNPLHVGEPGVGKTALVYGLARRINEGRVPERLKGSEIYLLDLGSMLADTQYRGDFEKRIKLVMEGVAEEGKGIVYIDEIHNLIGAGRIGEGSFDAANMLKPYLEGGTIRFIGSTTYGEFNRHFAKSPGIVRRFQKIDIAEPSVDDAVQILEGLRERYETFHGVVYEAGVFEHAVRMADRYINDRFLPDKAIDLIDEAGAQLETLRDERTAVCTKALIDEVLARICNVSSFADSDDDTAVLADLEPRIKRRIYGQDIAVRQVVEAVQMSRAGLLDDNKPVASFLFVGPTGVGKTEVARVLAQELNLELIRFDMSEYAEKHTVAKLIGSPAGYVGYDDGGLLTDAVRKTPHCVLLFDEIEKAHPDVFNIFLQMMDYARLTDNKGRKTDFRHAVIIMTSNAGAQYASQASVGFASTVSSGEAMLRTVRKTFKPEFIARLSATVVFRDMDVTMAEMILDKKLAELSARLATKGVTMTLSPAARAALLSEGFTRRTGAREMDRVIALHLKPLFTRAILFGTLKEGGAATVEYAAGTYSIAPTPDNLKT